MGEHPQIMGTRTIMGQVYLAVITRGTTARMWVRELQ